MYTPITLSDFHAAFKAAGCEDNFTCEGREHLFKYLEELEEDIGKSIIFDVIALRREYTESTLEDAAANYGPDVTYAEDTGGVAATIVAYFERHTTVVWSDSDRILYANF